MSRDYLSPLWFIMALGASPAATMGFAQVEYPDLTQQADGVVAGKISPAQNNPRELIPSTVEHGDFGSAEADGW